MSRITVPKREEPSRPEEMENKMEVASLNVWYGANQVLHDVSLPVKDRKITALIGPSGCGKSTFLRCLNRMNDLVPEVRIQGRVTLGGTNIYGEGIDVVSLRRRIGMVFQHPNPFPKTIFENVAYGPRRHGVRRRAYLEEIVERSLQRAALWEEVKDRLKESALNLSGGQSQRLCIARALAVEPEVLLMDEPASALDPVATAKIEDLAHELKETYSIVIVTHNMQQAARVSDVTAFLLNGRLIEYGRTDELFTHPRESETEAYITGRIG